MPRGMQTLAITTPCSKDTVMKKTYWLATLATGLVVVGLGVAAVGYYVGEWIAKML